MHFILDTYTFNQPYFTFGMKLVFTIKVKDGHWVHAAIFHMLE